MDTPRPSHPWAGVKPQSWLVENNNLWTAVAHGSLSDIIKYSTQRFHDTEGIDIGCRGLVERGGEGETILHAAILFNRSLPIIKWILANFKELVNEQYIGSRYEGETALHLAVAQEKDHKVIEDNINDEGVVVNNSTLYNPNSIVGMLFKYGAKLGENGLEYCAIGNEFNRSQKNEEGEEKGTLRHYGETILHFAAVSGKVQIVEYLIDVADANVNAIDRETGNNILHLLIENEDIDKAGFTKMFKRLRLKNPSLLSAKNNLNCSPLELGIKIQSRNMLEGIKEVLWEFDRTCRYCVPLNLLDNIHFEYFELKCKGNVEVTPVRSLLETVIAEQNEEILDHPIMRTILQWKWNAYARHIFFRKWILVFILIVFIVTPALALQPNSPTSRRSYNLNEPRDAVRVGFEAATIAGTVILFLTSGFDFKKRWNAADTYLRWLFCAIIFVVPIIRAVGSNDFMFNFENVVFGLAMISGYLYLLTFSKGSATIGHLVVIVKEIVVKDFVEWLLVYVPITVGFGGALFMQMQNVGGGNDVGGPSSDAPYDWDTMIGSLLWAVRFIFQEEKYEDIRKGALPVYAQLLFVTYALFSVVLLVNVLIAKLVNTFDRITVRSEKVWRMQLAALIMSIDTQLSFHEKEKIVKNFGFQKDGEDKTPYLQFTERERRDDRGRSYSEVIQVVAHRDYISKDVGKASSDKGANNELQHLSHSVAVGTDLHVKDEPPRTPPTSPTSPHAPHSSNSPHSLHSMPKLWNWHLKKAEVDEAPKNTKLWVDSVLETEDLQHWRGWREEFRAVFNQPRYNVIPPDTTKKSS
ncbi:ankyrin [Rhizoclosmatium globosum]|uniref:Ankyrin n=1 Tax=Rhizoclosmatium globosum TaxID=329046 RepID=A0A1Y2CRR1_9FUNG|nr:ankyrin [Rhizoclosmatium globosum]|eukprot:ORY49045.1 ankyrin [Rhizoclosmatium globosum]